MTLLIAMLMLVMCSGVAWAQDVAEADEVHGVKGHDEPWRVRLFIENDVQRFNPYDPTDRYYTNGTALSFDYQPDWADALAEHMPFADAFGPARTGAGFTFGHLMFSPEDITTPAPLPNDHPFAGYLYGGVFWQRANDVTLDHFQLDLGWVGPSAQGEALQKLVHDLTGGIDPQGWDNQLRDEPTVQLTLRKKWRFALASSKAFDVPLDLQLLPQVGLALGTVRRNINGGMTFRLGYQLPDDFGPARLADLGDATGQAVRGLSAYSFARLGGRIVAHDLFIEGNTWRSSLGRNVEPFVGELQVGALVAYHWQRLALELGYSITIITAEFDTQDGAHSFAAWTLGLKYTF